MEKISSRKNEYIKHLRKLAADSVYRSSCGEFVCEGRKFLDEALSSGAEISSILWKDGEAGEILGISSQYTSFPELYSYASFSENSKGPLFTVKIKQKEPAGDIPNAIILESVQDPGNLGTVIRTAAALGIGAVILTGTCADLYNPKTVKATMGAIFRQRVLKLDRGEIASFAEANSLTLCAAILSDEAEILGETELGRAAVCIGNEGSGLSRELSDLCRRKIIIPMQPGNESLNASVAASVFMWEMRKNG